MTDAYVIGPRDQVQIDVFGGEAFSGTFRVGESGGISIPLLGQVDAAGLTPVGLEERMRERLRETYMKDPHVTVQVTAIESHGVSVIGSVRRPGVYQVTGRRTLLEVLAMAEGVTEGAGSTVHVLRYTGDDRTPGTVPGDSVSSPPDSIAGDSVMHVPDVIEVELEALLEAGSSERNIVVRAGDVVQVRPAGMIYVVGEVNRPGGFTMPAGRTVTVLQAVALAQGLGSTAKADEGLIVRHDEDGSRTEVPVDLEAVLDGSSAAPTMNARDVLYVPKNGGKAAVLGVVNALVGMVTFRGLFY